MKNLLE